MILTRQKVLSARELDAYKLLDQLGIDHIAIPHRLDGSVLCMAAGEHPSRLDLNVVQLYREVLVPLYQHCVPSPSAGIYSFNGSGALKPGVSFLQHLLHEVEAIASGVPDKQSAPNHFESFELFASACKKFDGKYNPGYHLLHGDLFLGNILLFQGKFCLIDFEYLRFGPTELELAFLLCWDFITKEYLAPYSTFVIRRDIDALVNGGHISTFSAKLISECLIPMYVALAQLNSLAGIYSDSTAIMKSSRLFWDEYRSYLLTAKK